MKIEFYSMFVSSLDQLKVNYKYITGNFIFLIFFLFLNFQFIYAATNTHLKESQIYHNRNHFEII